MDLLAYAFSKKNSGSSGGGSAPDPIIPTIGENGNWFIQGIDTGMRAVPQENVEVDGVLKADTAAQKIVVVKDGKETVVGEYTTSIALGNIKKLFD